MSTINHNTSRNFAAVARCGDGGFDLRPSLDATMDALKRAVDENATGDPVYFFVGESHKRSAHKAWQQAMVSRLLDEGYSIALGLEHDEHTPREILEMLASEGGYCPTQIPSDRESYFKAFMTLFQTECSPLSRASFLGFCYMNGVDVSLNDARAYRTGDNYMIGAADYKKIFPEYKGAADVPLDMELWLALRNIIMARKIEKHVQSRGHIDVYMQHMGQGHLFWNNHDNKCFERYSMRNIFRDAGRSVVSVPLDSMLLQRMLIRFTGDVSDTIVIKGMNKAKANNVPCEAALFQEICARSGNEIALVDIEPRKDEWIKQIACRVNAYLTGPAVA